VRPNAKGLLSTMPLSSQEEEEEVWLSQEEEKEEMLSTTTLPAAVPTAGAGVLSGPG